MAQLSLIILNYKTPELTISCIHSIFEHYSTDIQDGKIEVILVDNASHDESIPLIKKQVWFSKIQLVENKENYGFSKGSNIGAVYAKGSTILFLNSDTQMQSNGLLQMSKFLQSHENIGIVGGRLQNEDGTYQPSVGVFYTLPRVFLLLLGAERFGKLRYNPTHEERVDWVSGAMIMIKKNLFEKMKGFDEKLFMYMEDMELCYRAKLAGKSVYFYSGCTIKHLSHGSSNRSFAIVQIYKGLLYFFKKHTNFVEYSIVKVLLILKALILLCAGFLFGKKILQQTYSKALGILI